VFRGIKDPSNVEHLHSKAGLTSPRGGLRAPISERPRTRTWESSREEDDTELVSHRQNLKMQALGGWT